MPGWRGSGTALTNRRGHDSPFLFSVFNNRTKATPKTRLHNSLSPEYRTRSSLSLWRIVAVKRSESRRLKGDVSIKSTIKPSAPKLKALVNFSATDTRLHQDVDCRKISVGWLGQTLEQAFASIAHSRPIFTQGEFKKPPNHRVVFEPCICYFGGRRNATGYRRS